MPRLVHQPPKYSKHKASGQAVVVIGGADVYLGPYGSKASRENYDRAVAQWLASGRGVQASVATSDSLTIARVIALFW
jgi:hypothetical protein